MGHIQTYDDQTLLADALAAIRTLRAEGARVHCITNTVAQNFTANVLLACGATPSMTVSPQEAPLFTGRADALLINLGTLDDDRMAASRASLEAAVETGKPTVLDPVMCHLSPPRLAFASGLLQQGPTVLRANADEAAALAEGKAIPAEMVHVETAATDRIRFGKSILAIENGHPWMASVTAVGCAQGALIAALAAKTHPATAALAALLWTGVAGEIAAARSAGPGTFQMHFIDALHGVSTPELEKRGRVSLSTPTTPKAAK